MPGIEAKARRAPALSVAAHRIGCIRCQRAAGAGSYSNGAPSSRTGTQRRGRAAVVRRAMACYRPCGPLPVPQPPGRVTPCPRYWVRAAGLEPVLPCSNRHVASRMQQAYSGRLDNVSALDGSQQLAQPLILPSLLGAQWHRRMPAPTRPQRTDRRVQLLGRAHAAIRRGRGGHGQTLPSRSDSGLSGALHAHCQQGRVSRSLMAPRRAVVH